MTIKDFLKIAEQCHEAPISLALAMFRELTDGEIKQVNSILDAAIRNEKILDFKQKTERRIYGTTDC